MTMNKYEIRVKALDHHHEIGFGIDFPNTSYFSPLSKWCFGINDELIRDNNRALMFPWTSNIQSLKPGVILD
jgi:hypothetical protein